MSAFALGAALMFSGCQSSRFASSGQPRKVLLVTATTGFHHTSTVQAEQVIPLLGQRTGQWTVDIVKSGPPPRGEAERKAWEARLAADLAARMSPEALKQYDAVVFANTTGVLPLPDKQAFLDWIKSGKGFVGIHSATDTFHGPNNGPVDPYIEMIGGEFKTHGPQVKVECFVMDPAHPSVHHLGKSYSLFDEIYEFKNHSFEKVHGLLTLNQHPQSKQPGAHPVAWCSSYGKGRVFYTSLGHREDVWDPEWKDNNGRRQNTPEIAEAFQQHLIGGIRWALGLARGSSKPDGVVVVPQ